ncbi:ExbD/TolR family protein [Thauera chlorobenzoica]|uniref:Tol biopolymer transport system, TolR protein n=1 Tax=Thauera chlorobenzoica TaxID=96773 RepID=A0A1H5WQ13_9RHOO|nr:ExbD/TolR family protein [Thauera chlorobenzoica]APR04472.1 Tol biopolymer transport system, TolR protein [Thauera chlorobenzoica]SEG01393.1 Cell division and transport-associated protein TolR [Thauera chlorobenzoica]
MRQRRLMNQINVVPYIDVMLVLLVIFMVTAPMVQTGNIDVPSAGQVSATPAEAIVIEVKADGTLALRPSTSASARPVSNLEFQRALGEALQKNPEQTFLVAADSKLDYQKVIDVLEAARLAGVRKISLQTKSGGGGR